jgi:NADH-quinone oxidoreductase subunit A
MLQNYLPVLVFVIMGVLISLAIVIASKVVAKILRVNKPSAEKLAPFECGFGEFEDARTKFDVRFYLVAILFIVFDLEVAFLFPWAVVVRQIGWYGFAAMGVFLALLLLGFAYEWKKGALEWE